LEQKVHETILEINLSALIHNFQIVKQTLNPDTRIMAMVKAAAYGAGGDEVARALVFNKVNYLAVAYTDEGVALRKAGINVPIMVMNPEPNSFSALLQYGLEPEIYSLRLLKAFLTVNDESVVGRQVHLKLNTGMNRLGFDKADLEELKILLHQHPELKVASIFTHLAATDDTVFNDFTRLQIQRFTEMYEIIVSGLIYKPWRHVLNSNGTLYFPDFQFEMVRLGITLYGVGDENNNNSALQTVMSLKATISQIRTVPKTETIGYSRKGKLQRDSVIATISIGYADGLHRKAGNHNFAVWLHHKTAPIIGNVCMDMTMIDVTDIPEAKEGDKVEIFGTHISVQNLANKTQTIPYEIFTSISPRVKRVYFQEWQ
jgi:alanine racemase